MKVTINQKEKEAVVKVATTIAKLVSTVTNQKIDEYDIVGIYEDKGVTFESDENGSTASIDADELTETLNVVNAVYSGVQRIVDLLKPVVIELVPLVKKEVERIGEEVEKIM